MKARVEDPFQLVGMNALGLPGTSIDGILGFTVLARFQLELDPTQDRMTWTRLDFEPEPIPPGRPGEDAGAKPAGRDEGDERARAARQVRRRADRQAARGRTPPPAGSSGSSCRNRGKRVECRVARVLAGSPAGAGGLKPRRPAA